MRQTLGANGLLVDMWPQARIAGQEDPDAVIMS